MQKDHNDVKVEDEGTDDVVVDTELVALASNDELSVNQKEESVDDYHESTEEWDIRGCVREHDRRDDAHENRDSDDDHEAHANEGSAQLREVIFGEHGVECQRDGHYHSHECSRQHDHCIVLGTNDTDHKRPADREHG